MILPDLIVSIKRETNENMKSQLIFFDVKEKKKYKKNANNILTKKKKNDK